MQDILTKYNKLNWSKIKSDKKYLEYLLQNKNNQYAQFYICMLYEYGIHVEKNLEEAIKWLKLSAKQDYSIAQTHLAYLYAAGEGVEKNLEEAVKWYKISAN